MQKKRQRNGDYEATSTAPCSASVNSGNSSNEFRANLAASQLPLFRPPQGFADNCNSMVLYPFARMAITLADLIIAEVERTDSKNRTKIDSKITV